MARKPTDQYDDYSIVDPERIPDGPDVLLDVPVVKVDEIDIEVDDLHAQLAVMAEVTGMVELSVGAEARLGKVELNFQGVEAQALVKARLDNVSAILQRVMLSLDRNPELLASVGEALERVGSGAGSLLADAGEGVEHIGAGAGEGVGRAAGGAGRGLSAAGRGAGEGVGRLGRGG